MTAARITASAAAAMIAEAEPPPSLLSRNSVSREEAKSNGLNSARPGVGVTQAAISGSSRQLAYCRAVS